MFLRKLPNEKHELLCAHLINIAYLSPQQIKISTYSTEHLLTILDANKSLSKKEMEMVKVENQIIKFIHRKL